MPLPNEPRWYHPCEDLEYVPLHGHVTRDDPSLYVSLIQSLQLAQEHVDDVNERYFHDVYHQHFENLSAAESGHYDWLPSLQEIPTFRNDDQFNKMIDTYSIPIALRLHHNFLQRYAVVFEQLIEDLSKGGQGGPKFVADFQPLYDTLIELLCELEQIMRDIYVDVPNPVPRSIMPDHYRNLRATELVLQTRNYILMRDYVNALDFMKNAYETLVDRLQNPREPEPATMPPEFCLDDLSLCVGKSMVTITIPVPKGEPSWINPCRHPQLTYREYLEKLAKNIPPFNSIKEKVTDGIISVVEENLFWRQHIINHHGPYDNFAKKYSNVKYDWLMVAGDDFDKQKTMKMVPTLQILYIATQRHAAGIEQISCEERYFQSANFPEFMYLEAIILRFIRIIHIAIIHLRGSVPEPISREDMPFQYRSIYDKKLRFDRTFVIMNSFYKMLNRCSNLIYKLNS